jgi:hypothetical protein
LVFLQEKAWLEVGRMSNGCVSPDGRLSERAIELLKLLKEKGRLKDTEIAEYAQRPLFFTGPKFPKGAYERRVLKG